MISQKTREGIETKKLYIKHMSLDDWKIIETIKQRFNMSMADVMRNAIRNYAKIKMIS